ncbi:hypothetical protein [Alteromonas gracilis]|uniref:hypothetical protein n=1 Tax=Alteromonas gracilis TaxID=1479524 RepID=UPI0037363CA0
MKNTRSVHIFNGLIIGVFTIGVLGILNGCAMKPTVHVYAKYLAPEQRTLIKSELKKSDVAVEFNDFAFPTSITTNTLLYSLLLQDVNAIDNTYSALENVDFPIHSIQTLKQENHWYTKNSLAVFLFPDGKKPNGSMFKQDLLHAYQSDSCGDINALTLNSNGTFSLSLKNSSQENNSTTKTNGHWKYRQYPYLELQEHGSPYSNFYFEISTHEGEDRVSKLSFIKLTLLNANSNIALTDNCEFVVGQRI